MCHFKVPSFEGLNSHLLAEVSIYLYPIALKASSKYYGRVIRSSTLPRLACRNPRYIFFV